MMEPTVLHCTCHAFASWSSILDFIESDEKYRTLEAWLDDDGFVHSDPSLPRRLSRHSTVHVWCHEFRWSSHSPLRHSSHGNCTNRRAAAMFIIQHIRDACRHVSQSNLTVQAVGVYNKGTGKNDMVQYEESFPSLTHSSTQQMEKPTLLTARKKNPQHQKPSSSSIPTVPAPSSAPTQTPFVNTTSTMPSMPRQVMSSKETAIMNRAMNSNASSSSSTSLVSTQKHAWGKSEQPVSNPTTTAQGVSKSKDDGIILSPVPGRPDTQELMVQRLVSIYSILLYRHLVPSSVIEVHFLLSLLSLPSQNASSPSSSSSSSSTSLQLLFSTPQQCRHFAIQVFVTITPTLLWTLGPHLIHDLLHIPSFSHYIPYEQRNLLYQIWHDIIITSVQQTPMMPWNHNNNNQESCTTHPLLSTSIQFFFIQDKQLHSHIGQGKDIRAWKEAHSSSAANSMGLFSDTPLSLFLTLPFDEKRDSKHLYRSKELTSLFQNREQCRDSFLYQLRSFQQLKGSLLDPVQMDQHMQDSRAASKDVIQSLSPSNISWFAEFFCDLLLQIGLVPIQETDLDILSHVPDQDKLQKLHKRFTAKVPSSKSKHRPSSNQNNLPPVRVKDVFMTQIQSDYFFTGHQEFFYLFITWVDSHCFASHVQNRLQHTLTTFMNQPIDTGCQLLVAKLCLVSRFLGLLNFYPWWNEHQGKAQDRIALSGCNIPLLEHIEEAWIRCKLNITIPWIVDFLRMMAWHGQSLRSMYFRKVFGMLRSIQMNISRYESTGTQKYNMLLSNRSIVALYLEGLFSDMVGWADSEMLTLCDLPPTAMNDEKVSPDCVDRYFPFIFSKSLLSISSPHLDDLTKNIVQMIMNPTQSQSNTTAVTSKKLKPLSIGRGFSYADAIDGGLDEKTKIEDSSMVVLHKKLAGAFFHHHKDIEQISRFVSNQYVKGLSSTLVELFSPMIDALLDDRKLEVTSASTPLDSDSYIPVIRQIDDQIRTRMIKMTDEDCDSYIISSIRTLTRSSVGGAYVCRISSAITASETKNSTQQLLSSIIHSETKRKVDDFAHRLKKIQRHDELECKQSGPTSFIIDQIRHCLGDMQNSGYKMIMESLGELAAEFASLNRATFDQQKRNLVLKTLYSSSFDQLLSELIILVDKSRLCQNLENNTNMICDSSCFIGLDSLSQIIRLVLQVRDIGYRSKEASALLSKLSSSKLVKNLVLTLDDGKDLLIDASVFIRSKDATQTPLNPRRLSYGNNHDIYSVLHDLVESHVLSKCHLHRILRDLLNHSASQLVAIRCVGLLGLMSS